MRNKIEYTSHIFTTADIKSVNIWLASSPISRQLEANTITAVVETDDESIQNFVRNTPMRYYYRDRQRFLAYVQSVDRVGPRAYRIYGTSAIGLLMERAHVGGLYTGQTADQGDRRDHSVFHKEQLEGHQALWLASLRQAAGEVRPGQPGASPVRHRRGP